MSTPRGPYVPAIESTGVLLRAREPGHRYFRPPADQPRVVHIHVCSSGSAWEADHLLFRDYLREHPEARDAYAALKLELADRHRHDRIAYTEAKTAFVESALIAARRT
ncbi:MAG: GrpB family protein [Actinomycetota bacterium]